MKIAIWILILTLLLSPHFARSGLAQTSIIIKANEHSLFLSKPEEMGPMGGDDRFVTAVASEPANPQDPNKEPEFKDVEDSISDPLKPWNRAVFHFNDKFYFWVLKPVAQGYKIIVPQEFRICFRNFFSNLVMPVRSVNCLLQGKFKAAGNEVARFGLNTTLGFFGFFDQAKDKFHINQQDEDFGQTLGLWGMGPAFYIEWPILGPASLSDSIGFIGDLFLDPRTYLTSGWVSYGLWSAEVVNGTSLRIGEYEDLKKLAFDPYVAKRDAYFQYRKNKIMK